MRVTRALRTWFLTLILLFYLLAMLDRQGGPPYYPIELSALLMDHYYRKTAFLAILLPPCLLLCFARNLDWRPKGIGLSLFVMTLFDIGNEWALHLIGVLIFGVSLYQLVQNHAHRQKLFQFILLLYIAKQSLKFGAVTLLEQSTHLFTHTHHLMIYGCSGCNHPLTLTFLRLSALFQWLIFFLLFLIVE